MSLSIHTVINIFKVCFSINLFLFKSYLGQVLIMLAHFIFIFKESEMVYIFLPAIWLMIIEFFCNFFGNLP
jgi:hypothetical protein